MKYYQHWPIENADDVMEDIFTLVEKGEDVSFQKDKWYNDLSCAFKEPRYKDAQVFYLEICYLFNHHHKKFS